MINLKDESYLAETGVALLAKHFKQIAVGCWLRLFAAYPIIYFERVFESAGSMGKKTTINHMLAILIELSNRGVSLPFVNDQTGRIPAYMHNLYLPDEGKRAIAKDILRRVLILGTFKKSDDEWLKNTKEAFVKNINREYVNDVLVDVILETGSKSVLAEQIMEICTDYLNNRVNHKPQPPADWSRPVPNKAGDKAIWAILADFLQSPVQQVFDYQKNQNFRTDMENAIRHVIIDLKMETIKKKSPHTLRLTKTQDAYEKIWSSGIKTLQF